MYLILHVSKIVNYEMMDVKLHSNRVVGDEND